MLQNVCQLLLNTMYRYYWTIVKNSIVVSLCLPSQIELTVSTQKSKLCIYWPKHTKYSDIVLKLELGWMGFRASFSKQMFAIFVPSTMNNWMEWSLLFFLAKKGVGWCYQTFSFVFSPYFDPKRPLYGQHLPLELRANLYVFGICGICWMGIASVLIGTSNWRSSQSPLKRLTGTTIVDCYFHWRLGMNGYFSRFHNSLESPIQRRNMRSLMTPYK